MKELILTSPQRESEKDRRIAVLKEVITAQRLKFLMLLEKKKDENDLVKREATQVQIEGILDVIRKAHNKIGEIEAGF